MAFGHRSRQRRYGATLEVVDYSNTILLVGPDASPDSTYAAPMQALLTSLGYTHEYVEDANVSSTHVSRGYLALVTVGLTMSDVSVFKGEAIPMVLLNPDSWVDLGVTASFGTIGSTDTETLYPADNSTVNYQAPGGLTGAQVVYTSASTRRTLGANALINFSGFGGAAETGRALNGGGTAGARMVAWGFIDISSWTAVAEGLFSNFIRWALEVPRECYFVVGATVYTADESAIVSAIAGAGYAVDGVQDSDVGSSVPDGYTLIALGESAVAINGTWLADLWAGSTPVLDMVEDALSDHGFSSSHTTAISQTDADFDDGFQAAGELSGSTAVVDTAQTAYMNDGTLTSGVNSVATVSGGECILVADSGSVVSGARAAYHGICGDLGTDGTAQLLALVDWILSSPATINFTGLEIGFSVNNSGAPAAEEVVLSSLLTTAGNTVTYNTVPLSDDSGYDMLVMCASMLSSNQGATLSGTSLPTLITEGFIFDDWNIAATPAVQAATDFDSGPDAGTHPIATRAKIPATPGNIWAFSTVSYSSTQTSGGVGTGASVLAYGTSGAVPTIIAYDQGDTLVGGGSAAGKRVALGYDQANPNNLTERGYAMLIESLNWLMED